MARRLPLDMRTNTIYGTLGFVLSTLLLSATAPAGCASAASSGDAEDTSSVAQSIVVPEYRAYWDYAGVDLDSVTTSARNAGFHPVSISAYGTATAPRYAAVFVKRPAPLFHVVRGTGLSSFQAAFNAQAAQNFKPALLSFDGDASNPVWAASFVASTTGIPYTRTGLTSGDWSSDQTLEFWLEKAKHDHLIPTTISIYGTAASPRYAIVLEANTSNVEWSVGRTFTGGGYWNYLANETHAEYQARWNAQVPAGDRPAIVDLNGDERYVSLYRDDSVGPLVGRHGLTRAALDAEVATQKAAGLFPIVILGGGGADPRFAAFFAQSENPLDRVFSAAGSSASGDTTITAVDDVMKGFMTRQNVHQAALAILDGKRLVYSRGYTYSEPGTRSADSNTAFRMASVTKVVTGMEIMRLIDRKQLTLDDKVQDILQLKTHTGAWPPAAFGTIKIRDLLTHTFPSLAAGSATKCLKRDADASPEAATAMGVPLPVTLAQATSYSLAAADLVRDPDSSGSCYSNFGYELLGQVIQKKRGYAYFGALQVDIFGPLGTTHSRLSTSSLAQQPSNEALYRPTDLWTTGDVNVPGSPLVSTAYGGDNFPVLAAAGGLSLSATDMARVLAALNVGAGNPIYQNVISIGGSATTVDTLLSGPYGFDGSFSDGWGQHYYKGGYLTGLQSTVSFTRNGVSYVLFWARDAIAGGGTDNWWPSWPALETAIHGANLAARPDFFPAYGMKSL